MRRVDSEMETAGGGAEPLILCPPLASPGFASWWGVTLPGQEANYRCEPDAINVAEFTAVTPGAAGKRAG